MNPKKLPQIVEIEWDDTVSTASWGHRDERLARTKPEDMAHRTVGYLLRCGRADVVVAQNMADHIGTVSDTLQIPRGSIRRITRIQRS